MNNTVCECGKINCTAYSRPPIKKPFIEVIPELGIYVGISSLDTFPAAIKYTRDYGFEDTANWFEEVNYNLRRAVESEWNVDDTPITGDTTGI